ncbi:Undefined function [Listeria monocytogenes N53-1]|nr:Undefined function [Listeria monocytogenes]CCQ24361.1 Undefined function [Listeria monocytogenes N53-1]
MNQYRQKSRGAQIAVINFNRWRILYDFTVHLDGSLLFENGC